MTTDLDLRRVESSHFHRIVQVLISEAGQDELNAIKGLVFWRERELKQEMVQQYSPGDEIIYLLEDSKTEEKGVVHHLNKMSLSVHAGNGQYKAIPIERVREKAVQLFPSVPRFEYVGEHGVDLHSIPTEPVVDFSRLEPGE